MTLANIRTAKSTEKQPRVWLAKSGVTIWQGSIVGRYLGGTNQGYIDNIGADPDMAVVGVARHNCGTAPAGYTGPAFQAEVIVDELIVPVDFSTNSDSSTAVRDQIVYAVAYDTSGLEKGSLTTTGYAAIGTFWESDSSTSGRVAIGPSYVARALAEPGGGLSNLAPPLGLATVRGVVTSNVSNLASFTVASNDGLTYSAGQTLLLVNQTTGSQNGPYLVGTVTTGTAPLERPPWWLTGNKANPGFCFVVSEGTQGTNSEWILRTAGPITIDTTAVAIDMVGGNWVQGVSTAVGTMAGPSTFFFVGATLKARLSGIFEVHLDIGWSDGTTGDSVTFAMVTDTVADGAAAILGSANKVNHGVTGFGTYGTRGADWESCDTNAGAAITFNSAAFNTAAVTQVSEAAPTLTGLLANAAQKFGFHGIVYNAAPTGTTKTPFTIGNQVAFGVSVSATNTITVKSVRLTVKELPNQ